MTQTLAPLTRKQLDQLRADANDVRAAAIRKGVHLDAWDEAREREAARNHFALGPGFSTIRRESVRRQA
jgi:hypothetical protein